MRLLVAIALLFAVSAPGCKKAARDTGKQPDPESARANPQPKSQPRTGDGDSQTSRENDPDRPTQAWVNSLFAHERTPRRDSPQPGTRQDTPQTVPQIPQAPPRAPQDPPRTTPERGTLDNKDQPAVRPTPPPPPPPGPPAVVVTRQDMEDIRIFIDTASGASGQMPTPQQVLAALEQAESPAAKLVKSKAIVLTGARSREGVWAYEVKALQQGGLIAGSNGVEDVSAAELRRRLGR
ncbi:MAG TPA: hypothetical protein VKE74_27625 [Gemmataceae bacterium]|nr:hypothetical protein [Gemmataceae bacterium]